MKAAASSSTTTEGPSGAEELVEELENAVPIQADLTDEAQVERLFAESREALGGLDVCAAVAGAWPEEDVPVWRMTVERWESTLHANLTGGMEGRFLHA